jgi:hypothetical protein
MQPQEWLQGDTVIKMRADQDIIDGNAIVRGSPPIAGIRVMLARMLGHIKGKVQAAMQVLPFTHMRARDTGIV